MAFALSWSGGKDSTLALDRAHRWGDEPADLLKEFVARGYRALLVSIDLNQADARWLGREINGELIEEILAVPKVEGHRLLDLTDP